ncbi:MAG: hypothetical protein FRX49_01733 [Trebouxia sp. A1-2]|nr:MAG: hypothetical protein FRX49_01733 [Trebouxia sp. A1-2]
MSQFNLPQQAHKVNELEMPARLPTAVLERTNLLPNQGRRGICHFSIKSLQAASLLQSLRPWN